MSDSILKPKTLDDLQTRLHWVLRITAACCFIGHGAWGVITKEGWLPFFRSQGIRRYRLEANADHRRFRYNHGYFVARKAAPHYHRLDDRWAIWTAILRPISGHRACGNSGAGRQLLPPFMLLLMGGTFAMRWKDWFLNTQSLNCLRTI